MVLNTGIGIKMHCKEPCDKNWSADIDGEHTTGSFRQNNTLHCDYCKDDNCGGKYKIISAREFMADVISPWTPWGEK